MDVIARDCPLARQRTTLELASGKPEPTLEGDLCLTLAISSSTLPEKRSLPRWMDQQILLSHPPRSDTRTLRRPWNGSVGITIT
jgi:hypothetical protein